jgi:hypothetical protein
VAAAQFPALFRGAARDCPLATDARVQPVEPQAHQAPQPRGARRKVALRQEQLDVLVPQVLLAAVSVLMGESVLAQPVLRVLPQVAPVQPVLQPVEQSQALQRALVPALLVQQAQRKVSPERERPAQLAWALGPQVQLARDSAPGVSQPLALLEHAPEPPQAAPEQPSPLLLSLLFPLWRRLPPQPQLPLVPESSCESSRRRPRG